MGDRDIIKMRRYAGEDLDNCPHIVVLGSCKVGNFVVTTPTLNGLKSRFPDASIGFIGSDVTAETYSLSFDTGSTDTYLTKVISDSPLSKKSGNSDSSVYVYKNFKTSTVESEFTLQKLVNRSMDLYVLDSDFKNKIHSYNNLIPSGSRL